MIENSDSRLPIPDSQLPITFLLEIKICSRSQSGIGNCELGIILSCYTLHTMVIKRRHFHQVSRSFIAAGGMMLKAEVPREAAGISYFSLMAMFPAMLVLIALADTFLGWMHLHDTVVQSIMSLFPGSRQFLQSNLNDITTPSTTVVVSCMIVVFWSYSWIFTFMERAINHAWGTLSKRTFWESRLLSVALMILGGFSLLISAAITGFVSAARARAAAFLTISAEANYFMGWFWYLLLLGTGLLIAVLVFALVYKWTPHCRVYWREAFSGALVATVLWEIGSFIFVQLVPFFNDQRIHGKMGAVIALLTWVYTSNLIVIFGANFSAQLHWTASELPLPGSDASLTNKISRFPTRG
jgi:membrane protein